MRIRKNVIEDFLFRPFENLEDLRVWIEALTTLKIPRRAVCPNHDSPLDYLEHCYFRPQEDVVVWAPRGGGKTRLAAVATLIELLHFPGYSARILGGSLEQSLRMWEYLIADVESIGRQFLEKGRLTGRAMKLINGSTAAVLTQSERAVRGLRVQKLRCDEVEMFEPHIWEAAQLVTRSRTIAPTKLVEWKQPWRRKRLSANVPLPSRTVGGSIEAISTFHSLGGMMDRIVENAQSRGTRVIRWCLLEVLERCPPERECATCPLWEECQGVAKTRCEGFMRIDDAIAMKRRVSKRCWESEMLCRRPSVEGCVFPSFEESVHAIEHEKPMDEAMLSLAIDFGFHSPFVALWMRDDGRMCQVIDEYIQREASVAHHIEQIDARPWGKVRCVSCDPAGAARNEQTAESNVQLLRRSGFRVQSRASRIADGLELIRAALQPATGEPTLFVHKRCVKLIEALKRYRYPDGGGEIPIKDGVYDHPIDALRYFYVNRARNQVTGERRY